jgi:hypothetical protein
MEAIYRQWNKALASWFFFCVSGCLWHLVFDICRLKHCGIWGPRYMFQCMDSMCCVHQFMDLLAVIPLGGVWCHVACHYTFVHEMCRKIPYALDSCFSSRDPPTIEFVLIVCLPVCLNISQVLCIRLFVIISKVHRRWARKWVSICFGPPLLVCQIMWCDILLTR